LFKCVPSKEVSDRERAESKTTKISTKGKAMKRRREGLYHRNGIYCFRWKDKHGSWREKSTGEIDRAAALKFKKRWDNDNELDQLPSDRSAWPVAEAASQWVAQHAAHLKSEKGKRNELSLLRQLTKVLGARKLKSITLNDLKNYQRERSQVVGPRAINLELRILINVLKECNLWRPIGEHYRRLTEPESEIGQALTIEELQRLESVAASRDAWDVAYAAEVLAANSGLRGGEIKKLRIGAVDLENRRISIRRKSTKTAAGARLVELNAAATAAVVRLYRRAELLGATSPEHFLLPADLSRHTKNTDPLTGKRGFDPTRHQMSWRTAWRSLSRAAGFKRLRFHDLRHSFISLMGERGVPLQIVQAIVGHMSPAMTRYYTHISNAAARNAVELLDKMREQPQFVDKLVEAPATSTESGAKLLN
jgi:integrase